MTPSRWKVGDRVVVMAVCDFTGHAGPVVSVMNRSRLRNGVALGPRQETIWFADDELREET